MVYLSDLGMSCCRLMRTLTKFASAAVRALRGEVQGNQGL